jgi:YegS/Rv2252/BmrU family lipid kinase
VTTTDKELPVHSEKSLLIVNPTARHGTTAPLINVIEKLLASLPHDTVQTERPGHAAELAAGAAGRPLVIAAGGDGTVHEVLNGLMRIPEGDRPALAVLPTGSGNDTRRTLGVPSDLTEAALLVQRGVKRRFDVGSCNGTYFNNSFAAGLDAKVTAKAVEYKVTKKRSGLWLYLTALLHVLFHELEGFALRVSFDDGDAESVDTLIVAVTNGPTYGGGFLITPDAIADDGMFDVCMIDPLGLAEALVRLPFVVMGRHTHMKPVHMSRHRALRIESPRPLPAQVDGEVLLETFYEIRMHPGAIQCIVPGEES